MSANLVEYGLEQVHVAFKGVAQAESIEVTAGCGTDGEITVTVTGAPLTGGSEAVTVALSAESHAGVTQVASVVCNTLNNNADISANYTAKNIAGVITLAAKVAATNDATLEIAITPGSTGVTAGSSSSVAAGTTGWGVPTPVPGAVKWTPKAEGKESVFYADNGAYFTTESNLGYTGDLEVALIPDSILAQMLGWDVDANGGLAEVADGTRQEFALLGQYEGDAKCRRFAYYSCKASRPTRENRTKGETIEPDTEKLSLKVLPSEIGGRNLVKYVLELSDSNAAVYNAWFDAVQTPAA